MRRLVKASVMPGIAKWPARPPGDHGAFWGAMPLARCPCYWPLLGIYSCGHPRHIELKSEKSVKRLAIASPLIRLAAATNMALVLSVPAVFNLRPRLNVPG